MLPLHRFWLDSAGGEKSLRVRVITLTHLTPSPPSSPHVQVVGFDSAGGKKFKFEGEVTTDALVTFGEAVAAGTAQKFFKSGE